MDNTANLELFAVHKIVSEYAGRIYAYMKKINDYKTEDISVNKGPT
jgi:hypothetical protein